MPLPHPAFLPDKSLRAYEAAEQYRQRHVHEQTHLILSDPAQLEDVIHDHCLTPNLIHALAAFNRAYLALQSQRHSTGEELARADVLYRAAQLFATLYELALPYTAQHDDLDDI